MKNCVNGMIGAVAGAAMACSLFAGSVQAQAANTNYTFLYFAGSDDPDDFELFYPLAVDDFDMPVLGDFADNPIATTDFFDVLTGAVPDPIDYVGFTIPALGEEGDGVRRYLANETVDNGDGTSTQTLRLVIVPTGLFDMFPQFTFPSTNAATEYVMAFGTAALNLAGLDPAAADLMLIQETLLDVTGTIRFFNLSGNTVFLFNEGVIEIDPDGPDGPEPAAFPESGGFFLTLAIPSFIGPPLILAMEVDIVITYDNTIPTSGACCDGTVCVDDALSTECVGQDDTFVINTSCFNVSCGDPDDIGACCTDGNSGFPLCVTDTRRSECEFIGGIGVNGSTGESGVGLVRVGQDCSDNNAIAGADACEEQVVVEPCLGDANGDRAINVSDFIAVLLNFGGDGTSGGDANDDQVVNVADFIAVLLNFGSPCP